MIEANLLMNLIETFKKTILPRFKVEILKTMDAIFDKF